MIADPDGNSSLFSMAITSASSRASRSVKSLPARIGTPSVSKNPGLMALQWTTPSVTIRRRPLSIVAG